MEDAGPKEQLQQAQDIINALAAMRNELSDRLVQTSAENMRLTREVADLKAKLEPHAEA